MRIIVTIIFGLVGLGVLAVFALIAFQKLSFKDESIYSGEAFGFTIGESHRAVFEKAVLLKEKGRIEEIHRWPEGSYHFEFSEPDLAEATTDARWTMIVDANWWNNSIRLEFRDGKLTEINRFRMWGEMP